MERIQWVHKRLEGWAAWTLSGAGGGLPRTYDPDRVDQTADVRAGWRNSDPAFDAEALETDRAIAQLPTELKRAVMAAYRWEGGMQEIAAALGCTRATLHNRLCHADRRVRDWLEARKARAEGIRQRGEFLQLIHKGA